MRKLLIGAVLLITALVLAIPYLADRQIPAKFFPGVTIVRLYIHKENKIQPLQLEDYLIGVVAAEMPAEFPLDALKAQAVAARTYVVKRMGAGGVANPLHSGADVCDDPTHGQAWLSREDLKNRWGIMHYYNYYYKVKKAVDETSGQVLTWNGELIDPAYHSSCGGRTENSEDVWQFQVPYLRSVPCPYDANPQPVQTANFSLEQVDRALGTSLNAVPVTGKNASAAIKLIEKTSTGRPKSLLIDGKQFSAVAVRDLLGLRSTNFTWTVNSGTLTFTTTGNGHGVGMCQYGAKGMAEHGYNYRVILSHYYSGAEITTYKTSSQ
ncbi:stage II sporulation protein D [Pelotomaculum isophthalicicum JI]|uniref:Stage II sporulation protein D n=1 Tax=Pelotomaculum isophthalicicum JI TaxID=947010 RepID=A0A9X4JU45_9FIRM|nr:stage II sporulation protein D [Pelotomaculum isophthalicicum]MDF9409864.1 stage II sporulation protein D [Pelotomaculum isophthalicicum JI]